VLANVAEDGCAQQRVADGMNQGIAVRVPNRALVKGNVNAT